MSGKTRPPQPYYQVYIDNFYEVVGKGFIYELDTIGIKKLQDGYAHRNQMDSVINLPINENKLNQEFGRFGYEILSKNFDTVRIINSDKNDTINLKLDSYPLFGDRYFGRVIAYFKSESR